MWKLLVGCLALLALLYGAKMALLQLAVPAEDLSSLDEEDAGGQESDDSLGGFNDSDWRTGVKAFRRGNDEKALTHLLACAEKEPTRAACRTVLGEAHLVGAGMPRNLSEALRLFQEAADEGDPDAQYNLGVLFAAMHEQGADLRQREALAVLHLYAASTAGHPGALMAMGYRHMHGYGVPKACTTAALNYIEVAKKIASVYSAGMPQAVELIRLNLHQKDRKVISSSEMNLFVQIATSGDTTVAAAIGKRYLLGIEGFRQDYRKAKHYLRLAANRNHPGALSLLGYMYCLGLGTSKNLDSAYSFFVSASAQNDPLGHNGLGFIYFKGTTAQARNLRLAFRHFNESAHGGSSDGMFNLASMYLTGTGTEQSFQRAVLWYTQALDRGHTPAAYSLAVMHLNGIGTVRDCDIAVNLLKKVCERGEWVSGKLVDAYEFGDKQPDRASLLFLKLAEAGHEVAQMNVAHLLDSGQSVLLYPGSLTAEQSQTEESRQHNRIVAQRFYEMSAEQGSASSELRLGDYAFYGWGISAGFGDDEAEGSGASEEDGALPSVFTSNEPELKLLTQMVDYEASLARYRKTAEMTVTGEWMQAFVARGSFNLGFMHQFGLGVAQDLHLAKRHYHRCREVDPGGVHAPITLVLLLLGCHMQFVRLPPAEELFERLAEDLRVHVLVLHFVAIVALVIVRCKVRAPRPARSRASLPRPPETQN
jgi:TPR repeat protein